MSRYFIFFLFCTYLVAQEQFQFKDDNFSGINGVTTDPTHSLSTQQNWDVNILFTDAYINNSYTYISDASGLSLLKKRNIEHVNIAEGITGDTRAHTIDYYNNNDTKDAFVQAEIMGPSVFFRKTHHQTFGFYTRARALGSSRALSPAFNYYNFHWLNYGNPYFANKSDAQIAGFLEFAAQYARKIKYNKTYELSIGATAKYLWGTDGGYAKNKKTANFTFENDSLIVQNVDFEIGMSTGAEMYDSLNAGNYKFQKKGSGLALDAGLTFLKKRYTNDILIDADLTYKWKVNISLLDFGYIKYKNAEVHQFNSNKLPINSESLIDFDEARAEKTIEKYFQNLSQQFYGDETQSKKSNSFIIGLPTAINLNADYGISPKIFAKLHWVQRVPVFENSIKRSNLININLRYQKYWLGLSGGLSLYEYQNLYAGANLRIGPLIIGSDNIIPLFLQQDKMDRMDIYMGLKITPFWLNFLNNRHNCKTCEKF